MTLQERIINAKAALGESLVIFGHHYQNDKIIRYVDKSGDSLELARLASQCSAKHIVFCGVHFMGESAAILAGPEQKVYLPVPDADCVMARMAPAPLLDRIMSCLSGCGRKVIPLAYVNSSIAVKAVCGRYGGSVCTSSNGEKMLAWAKDQGDAVLFAPDAKLGRNMAKLVGIAPEDQLILNITRHGRIVEELRREGKLDKAKLLLWPGCCAIHARFHAEHIAEVRCEIPDTLVIVHPECSPEVVEASDFAGSTSAIINYVENAPDGSKIAVATEINLVRRLSRKYAGKKDIFPLLPSNCSDMAKVDEEKLAALLENIIAAENGQNTLNNQAKPLRIDPLQANYARKALQTMLDVCN